MMGRLDEALAQYRRAMTFGGSPSVLANIGTILYRQGKFAEALANYDQSLARRPGSQQTWRSKGDALNRLGRIDEARARPGRRRPSLAENMLTANPSDVYARSFLAVCRAKLGQDPRLGSWCAGHARGGGQSRSDLRRRGRPRADRQLDDSRSLLDRAIKAGYSAQ